MRSHDIRLFANDVLRHRQNRTIALVNVGQPVRAIFFRSRQVLSDGHEMHQADRFRFVPAAYLTSDPH